MTLAPELSTRLDAVVARDWRLLIGGRSVPAESGAVIDVHDPATGQVIAEIPDGSAADIDAAVVAAKAAFPAWRAAGPAARAAIVLALADAVEQTGEELAWLDTVDNGSPIAVMRGDYAIAVEQLRYYAGLALELRGETVPTDHPRSLDFSVREPFGVVGRVVPFNHPLMFAASRIAAPLIAGNTVVLKPAEQTSLSALRLGELARDIVPPGVLNIVSGTGAVAGDRLVRHPDVRRIAFTGGTEVGLRIQRAAAEASVKTVTLELGGKNPLIVFADADLAAAVDGAIRGMNFTWQGQSCGSTSRLYVHRSVFDEVVTAIGARLDAMVVGDPKDERTDVGAVVSLAQYRKVVGYLDTALHSPGVRLVAGGSIGSLALGTPDNPQAEPPAAALAGGWFVRPTLFAVEGSDDIAPVHEEIFGPVLMAMPFDDYDEVIARANSLDVGLTASVWTRDLGRAMAAAADLEAGYIWVNWSSAHIPGTSFGGVKNSGVGREEGFTELLGFTESKNVYIRY